MGAGGLGLNAIAVLRAMQHQNIVVVDISPEKREAALKAREIPLRMHDHGQVEAEAVLDDEDVPPIDQAA